MTSSPTIVVVFDDRKQTTTGRAVRSPLPPIRMFRTGPARLAGANGGNHHMTVHHQDRTAPSVPTAKSLSRRAARIDRQRRAAAAVIGAMRDDGATLHHLGAGWVLSNGLSVTPAVARMVALNPYVAAVGDSLFGIEFPELSQTLRWADPE
jgi:hypothetical protein